MNRKFADIINEGVKNGKSCEEINLELKAAGANFHLDPDGHVSGWTEAEMAEGFEPGDAPQTARRELDMSRKTEFAYTVQTQCISGGTFEVTYDEDGFAVKAVKVK